MLKKHLTVLLVGFFLQSCIGSGKLDVSKDTSSLSRPILSNYQTPQATYTKDQLITDNTLTNSGGSVTQCTSSPNLPAGLSLHQTTCAISGTPTAISTATNYTITASNAAGSHNITVNITVNDAIPVLASYVTATASYTTNTAITENTIANSGGTIISCTVSPDLPSGLSLSSTTCAISGTPTVASASQAYTVTATNSGGSANASITITVSSSAPSLANAYTTSSASYPTGTAITANTVTNSGGTISTCTISPDLPTGLAIASTTCTISGTPTTITSSKTYTVTASNSVGSSTVTLTIVITDGQIPTVTSNLQDNSTVCSGFILGTAADNVGVDSVEVSLDSATYATATGTTSWNYQLPVGGNTWKDDSSHTISVRSKDAAGNYSSVTTITVKKGANRDFNGDGYCDLMKGADGFNSDRGKLYIFHGSANGVTVTDPASANTEILEATDDYLFGIRSTSGDINGDGYADALVGSTWYNNGAILKAGAVYIFLGGSSGITDIATTTADATIKGATASDMLSGSLAAGDVNGDGYTDLMVGTYNIDAGDGASQGKVYIFHGSSTGISTADLSPGGGDTPTDAIIGAAASNQFAYKMATADVNGDGYADLAVSANQYDFNKGRVYIFHGSSTGIGDIDLSGAGSANTTLTGASANDYFGYHLALGDINGDSYSDILIGAYGYNNGDSQGRAYIYYGADSTGIASGGSNTITGETSGDKFAIRVAVADLDSNGYAEAIIGADSYDTGGIEGRVYIVPGAASMSDYLGAAIPTKIDGTATSLLFGAKLTLSDLNSDGYMDLVVGAEGYDTNTGRAFIYNGPNSTTAATTITGEGENEYF